MDITELDLANHGGALAVILFLVIKELIPLLKSSPSVEAKSLIKQMDRTGTLIRTRMAILEVALARNREELDRLLALTQSLWDLHNVRVGTFPAWYFPEEVRAQIEKNTVQLEDLHRQLAAIQKNLDRGESM